MSLVDVIIPLGPDSVDGKNDELRLFLRSLQKNGRGYDMIWLVTDCAPEWLLSGNGLSVIPYPDRYATNKDANLFEKVREGLLASRSEDVVFSADDCAVLKECDFATLPVLYNSRTWKDFPGRRKWHRRMRITLEELRLEGGNYDTHTPQRWNREKALAAIAETPYERPRGRCIDTAVMGRMFGRKILPDAVNQDLWKETAEGEKSVAALKLDKVFVVYNDDGFLAGLRERLFERFPEKSRWEVAE